MFFILAIMIVTAVISAMSGLWGVAVTDAFQFVIKMTGCIILAIIVVNSPQVGGIAGLQAKLPEWALRFTPQIGESATGSTGTGGIFMMTISTFLAYIGIQWWSSWYPGAEPGDAARNPSPQVANLPSPISGRRLGRSSCHRGTCPPCRCLTGG